MGRFLILVGLLMMIVGFFVGPILSVGNIFSAIQPTFDLAVDAQKREAELCQRGEKLQEEYGASEYTPGLGSGRPVTAFCVDEAGNRRDVTGDLVKSMLGAGGVGGLFGNLGSLFGKSLIFVGVGILGIIVLIGGIISSVRGRRTTLLTVGTPMVINRSGAKMSGLDASTLVSTLQALEQSLQAGLINQEEYEDARKRLLENLK